jgi:hypothetical protein
MIRYDQIRDRIESMRSDKKGRDGQLAFQIGARRLASETLALQEIVIFTLPAGALAVEPYSQPGAISTDLVADDGSITTVDTSTWEGSDSSQARESLYIFQAEYQDPVTGQWSKLVPYNQQALESVGHHLVPSDGVMRAFTSDHGRFRPNRPPMVDTQIRAKVAYQPTGDFDGVHFSHEFEDALVEGALAHFYRLPGPGRDPNAAADSENAFLSIAAGLRGITLIGDMGYHRGSTHPKRAQRWTRFMSNDTLGY